MGHAIVLFNDNRIQRFILECDGLALVAVDDDRLCNRFLHLESGGGCHLRDSELTGVEFFALLMELDLTVGIRKQIAIIRRGRGLRSLTSGRIGHMEFCTLNRCAGNRILLKNGDFRAFPVPEDQLLRIAGIEADRLHTVSILIRQIPGSGYGDLRDTICPRRDVLGHLAIGPSGPIVLIVAVDRFHPQYSARNRLLCVGIDLREGQLRLLQVLKNDLLLVAAV